MVKPSISIIGTDGNVYTLIARVQRALIKAGQKDKAQEFQKKALLLKSYSSVYKLITKYVEVE